MKTNFDESDLKRFNIESVNVISEQSINPILIVKYNDGKEES
jgi:hypothetical protein